MMVSHDDVNMNMNIIIIMINILMMIFVVLISLTFHLQAANVSCQFNQQDWHGWQTQNRFSISDRQLLVSTIYANVDVIVDTEDGLNSVNIKNLGTAYPQNIRNIARFIKKGDTILNVGSHIGFQVIVLGKLIGETGRIFIMEPYSVSYNIVLKNVYLNGLGDIATVYNVGASDKKTKGSIAVFKSGTGASFIYTDSTIKEAPVKTEEIRVDLVDSVIPQNAVIDFALIDVERMQIECLDGMRETILRSPNMVMMVQWSGYSFNSKDFQQKKKNLVQWLVQQKYNFYLANSNNNCENLNFTKMDPSEVIKIRSEEEIKDIFMVPSHIDPDTMF